MVVVVAVAVGDVSHAGSLAAGGKRAGRAGQVRSVVRACVAVTSVLVLVQYCAVLCYMYSTVCTLPTPLCCAVPCMTRPVWCSGGWVHSKLGACTVHTVCTARRHDGDDTTPPRMGGR